MKKLFQITRETHNISAFQE